MYRKAFLLAAFAFGLAVTGVEAQDGKKLKGKLDKGQAFDKLDANADGKLSKEEFKAGFDKLKVLMAEKGGDKAKKLAEKMDADKTFEKMDANKDGSISKSEYEKFEPLADLKKKTER
jgi:Ca2+-binding EF-hand superfamily protein